MNLQNAHDLTHQGILALARAERQGIRIDVKYAKKEKKKLTKLIDDLEVKFEETKFFQHWKKTRGKGSLNINSDQQLAYFLYQIKKIKPSKRTPSGQGSTDEEALKALGIPALDTLIRIRKLKKLRDTYLHSFLAEEMNGYIHPVYNLHLAATYRSSSDSPNFQNIPVRDEESKKIIRNCLYPRPGHQLVEIDFSSLEVSVAACYHKDPTMIRYLNDFKSDMHADMGKQIFLLDKFDKKEKSISSLRYHAKNGFVFPQFYGDYYGNNAVSLSQGALLPLTGKYKETDGIVLPEGDHLADHLIRNGIKSPKDFTQHIKEIEEHFWNKRFPVYKKWKETWWADYQRKGHIEMLTGFRCSGVMGKNEAINYPVQGAAFHCLLWSLIQMDHWVIKKECDAKIIGQIHDSILFDTLPEERERVLKKCMKVTQEELIIAWDWIIVPLRIDVEICEVDESWYHKK